MPTAANPSSYDASSSSYDATPRMGRAFSACLSIISVLCQLCMFITTTFATPNTGHMDAAFIIYGIHFDRAVLMIKLFI
jgi:hypothetical protein